MKKVLTIAGSDCSGGAGIQADMKTMTVHQTYAMSVITAITAQNTQGVRGVHLIPPQMVIDQIDAVFQDIVPDAVKTGMLGNSEVMEAVISSLCRWKPAHLVVDPVMVSTSGHSLLEGDVRELFFKKLFPLAELVTPNIPEAQVLSGMKISSRAEMQAAGQAIASEGKCSVLMKGGHWTDEAFDLLVMADGSEFSFTHHLLDSKDTHGTGCTLSSAIACNLANGHSLPDAVQLAKNYITRAIAKAPHFGQGHGPVNHLVAVE